MELVFAVEWATLGLSTMVLFELFADLTMLITLMGHVLARDTTLEDMWDYAVERYNYSPGDVIKAWAETMVKKAEEACL